ncbi:MAG: hypothetical protein M3Z04_04075 [Chloroflexota bacterium]|nr:hypothetical protein [Chloroflexota bacterium]
MTYWKSRLTRIALSTAALTLFAALGVFAGAMFGAVVELAMQTVLDLAIPAPLVVSLFALIGLTISLVWWVTVMAQAHATTEF